MTITLSWIQLHTALPEHQIDEFSEALEESGCIAIDLASATEEEIIEPTPQTTPLWQKTAITALFPADTDMLKVIALLHQLLSFPLPEFKINTLAEQNWLQNLQREFVPMQFGDQLWIHSSWNQPPPNPEITAVLLDPGLAFGTGTHPTTALCLDWLAHHSLKDENIIDYGCGSGILAVAAIKLGAKQAWATDIDLQALQATQHNAENNHVAAQIMISLPEQPPTWPADIIVSNIILRPLIELIPTFLQLLKPNGLVVLSGVLERQLEELKEAYQKYFEIIAFNIKDDWACLVARKR